MPLNPLFWMVLAVVAAGACANAARRRSAKDERTLEKGKIPGYSRTPGENVSLDESVIDVDGAHWHPLSLETFHSSERSRLILSIEIDSMVPEIKAFLERLAREAQARTQVNVVYVEVHPTDAETVSFLYAPDGLGWSGHERVQEVYRDKSAEVVRHIDRDT